MRLSFLLSAPRIEAFFSYPDKSYDVDIFGELGLDISADRSDVLSALRPKLREAAKANDEEKLPRYTTMKDIITNEEEFEKYRKARKTGRKYYLAEDAPKQQANHGGGWGAFSHFFNQGSYESDAAEDMEIFVVLSNKDVFGKSYIHEINVEVDKVDTKLVSCLVRNNMCSGPKQATHVTRRGPMIMQQTVRHDACVQQGWSMDTARPECRGSLNKKVKETVKLHIPEGAFSGFISVLKEAGNQTYGKEFRGDIKVVVVMIDEIDVPTSVEVMSKAVHVSESAKEYDHSKTSFVREGFNMNFKIYLPYSVLFQEKPKFKLDQEEFPLNITCGPDNIQQPSHRVIMKSHGFKKPTLTHLATNYLSEQMRAALNKRESRGDLILDIEFTFPTRMSEQAFRNFKQALTEGEACCSDL